MTRKTKLFLLAAFLVAVVPDWAVYLAATRVIRAGEYEKASTMLLYAFFVLSALLVVGLVIHFFLVRNGRYERLKQTAKADLLKKETQIGELSKETINLKSIVQALSDNYDCIYLVNMETNRFKTIYESDRYYRRFGVEETGDDFFALAQENIKLLAEPEDLDYLLTAYQKKTIIEKLKETNPYALSYRIIEEGYPAYYQTKMTCSSPYLDYLVIGIMRVDEQMRHDLERRTRLEQLLQKESIYKEVILTNAAGYFEFNLTKNLIISNIFDYRENGNCGVANIPEPPDPLPYDMFRVWWCDHMLFSGAKAFLEFTDRANLIKRFYDGENIVENICNVITKTGGSIEYSQTYYMAREEDSGDIIAICTLRDKTEQRKREQQVKMLEEALKESRIKNFVSQMQPHFLYNALGSIREIVLKDPQYASDLIYDFTTHLRACIKSMSNDDAIPFSKELENIKAYVRIEQMRFRDKLHVEYDIEAEDFPIIPLTIQPLVENAIRHGIYERGSVGGTVTIQTRESDDNWTVQITDDGVGFDAEKTKAAILSGGKDSTGLYNLIFRLEKTLYATVDIKSEIGVGTCVTVRIPKGDAHFESNYSG